MSTMGKVTKMNFKSKKLSMKKALKDNIDDIMIDDLGNKAMQDLMEMDPSYHRAIGQQLKEYENKILD